MNTHSFAINRQALENMQKNPAHNLLGDNLTKIIMQKPEIAGKKLVGDNRLATKNNHAETLENLAPDALIEFVFEVIAPHVYTSFSHKLLAEQNKTAQEISDKMRVYANMDTIELERDSFLGQALDASVIHGFIKQFVKNSKDANKIAKRWRKRQGSYEVKVDGEFIPYASKLASTTPIVDSILTEIKNLAPIVLTQDFADYDAVTSQELTDKRKNKK